MNTNCAPFVYWAQTTTEVTLRVDLKDVKDPQILLEEEEVEFTALGCGSHGVQRYNFVLEFYLPVNKGYTYDLTDREVRIKIQKKEADWWPRLLYEQKKLAWLRVDFDRMKHESETEEETENVKPDLSYEEVLKTKYPDAYEKLKVPSTSNKTVSFVTTQKEELGFLNESWRKGYLFIYNFFMFCGFLYAITVMSLKYSEDPEVFPTQCWETIGNVFKFMHLLMYLEVLNPMFGYTKGSIVEAMIQVTGRCIWIFCLIDSEPRMHSKPVVFYLFMTYSTIEIFRYPYYLFALFDKHNGLLTWIRYTIWIPLYPLGFICEGVIALRNIPYFEETEKFSVLLPNKWNFAFYFPNVIRFYLLLGFFPMLYTQMWHMYQLRCKKLGIKQHKSNKSIIKKDD